MTGIESTTSGFTAIELGDSDETDGPQHDQSAANDAEFLTLNRSG